MGSMCARTGGVLAPMMYLLKSISPHAPMVVCGLCPLLGSALTLLLPETANQHLPDTIQDVEGSTVRSDTLKRLFSKGQFTPITNNLPLPLVLSKQIVLVVSASIPRHFETVTVW